MADVIVRTIFSTSDGFQETVDNIHFGLLLDLFPFIDNPQKGFGHARKLEFSTYRKISLECNI